LREDSTASKTAFW